MTIWIWLACFPSRSWDTGPVDVDSDGDGTLDSEDCAPDDPGRHPAAWEVCNGLDDDCDGLTDDEDDTVYGPNTWGTDGDGDGYGDAATAVEACLAPSSDHLSNASDCDDDDASISPDATELCDGIDNDCDGETDEGSAADAFEVFFDYDGDGYGRDDSSETACSVEDGWAAAGGDCADTDPDVNPGVPEVCNDLDDDCDDELDEGLDGNWYRDQDGDGYGDPDDAVAGCPDDDEGWVPNQSDCDDSDASVTGPEAAYADLDGDGYGDPDNVGEACEEGSGYVFDDSDCDDDDAEVHPEAFDFCGDAGDGIDNDCDGTVDGEDAEYTFYVDSDGDGYGADEEGTGCAPTDGLSETGGDCDDTDDGIHPDADERYGEGTDLDCDGDLVHGIGDAHAVFMGASSSDQAGQSVLGDLDVDGDGATDFVIGAWAADTGGGNSGSAYVQIGAAGVPSGEVTLSGVELYGESAGDGVGWSLVSLGDLDADGLDDLAVSAPGQNDGGTGAGAVYVASGDWISSGDSSLDLSLAQAILIGEASGDEAGRQLASADFDGDGVAELLVGAEGHDSGRGAVYVVSGLDGEIDLSTADAVIVGDTSNDALGPVATSDVDGDGVPDLLLGAPYADDDGTQSGSAYLFLGPVTGDLGADDADLVLTGEAAYAYAGTFVGPAGDADGDGLDDVLVGSPGSASGSFAAGAGYLVSAATLATYLDREISLGGADATFEGEGSGDSAGTGMATADVDGDGELDLAIGAPNDDEGATNGGAMYVVLGPHDGTRALSEAWIKVVSDDTSGQLGAVISGIGDLDGDTRDELVVGAVGDSTATSGAGAAWLLLGGEL